MLKLPSGAFDDTSDPFPGPVQSPQTRSPSGRGMSAGDCPVTVVGRLLLDVERRRDAGGAGQSGARCRAGRTADLAAPARLLVDGGAAVLVAGRRLAGAQVFPAARQRPGIHR
ncbi:hypothetical protein SDC9_186594 [bioreactor metagenome]|uniref:Uncharacterized protein n=1 Tax=bioreactor metagenome TaxID=1076179 RepID=A0A645HJ78_9ZZZZ